MEPPSSARATLLPGILGAAAATVYLILFLSVESQTGIALLLAGGAIVILAAARFGALERMRRSFVASASRAP